MAAPKKPNPEPGAAARRRAGDETAAGRLRRHGWLVFPPEVVKLLPAQARARLVQIADGAAGRPE